MIPPDLVPVDLDACSLTLATRRCQIPGSPHYLPILALEGTVGERASTEQDLLVVRCAMAELRDAERSHRGMVVDARQLRGVEALSDALFPAKVLDRHEPHAVVAGGDFDAVLTTLVGTSAPVPEDYEFDGSALTFAAFSWTFAGAVAAWGQVDGFYRRGSAGDDDALFVRWRVNRLFEKLEPRFVIIDLRGLDYEWGDKLDPYPQALLPGQSAIRFVIDPARYQAFRFVLQAEHICTSVEEAIAALG